MKGHLHSCLPEARREEGPLPGLGVGLPPLLVESAGLGPCRVGAVVSNTGKEAWQGFGGDLAISHTGLQGRPSSRMMLLVLLKVE